MTTTIPDPLPLPEAGATTSAIVPAPHRLSNPSAEEQARLDNIVEAVNAYVRGLRSADVARGSSSWPANIVEGSTMLAGRIWRRKDTPGGVFSVGEAVP